MRRVFAAALAPFRLGGASALSPEAHAWATGAALAFAVSLGVQLTVWAILAVGPLAEPFAAGDLTSMGRKSMRPEYDLPAFYAGCLATVVFAWGAVRFLQARLAGLAATAAERAGRRSTWTHAGLAVASLGGFSMLAEGAGVGVGADGRLATAALLRMALPATVAVAVLAIDHVLARRAST